RVQVRLAVERRRGAGGASRDRVGAAERTAGHRELDYVVVLGRVRLNRAGPARRSGDRLVDLERAGDTRQAPTLVRARLKDEIAVAGHLLDRGARHEAPKDQPGTIDGAGNAGLIPMDVIRVDILRAR